MKSRDNLLEILDKFCGIGVIGNRVLLYPLFDSVGDIELPDIVGWVGQYGRGLVLGISSGCGDKLGLGRGDVVWFNRYSYEPYFILGEEVYLVDGDNLVAVEEDDNDNEKEKVRD